MIKRLWDTITFDFLIGVRWGMCAAERRQLCRKRLKLTALAGDRITQSPYPMIFTIIDNEIAEIDGEISSIKAANSFQEFDELEYQRSLNKMVSQSERFIAETDAFLLGLVADYLPETDPTDVANVMNFLEENR